jgi:hypothetical protein
VLLSLSYVAPAGAFKSATAGLADAGRPYFSQTWNVFAPNIMKANVELEVTAQWRAADGELQHGEWFSATGLELQAVAGHPVPSRIVKQTWNLIRAYNTRFVALNPEQRDVVRDTFIRGNPDDGYAARSDESIVAELDALGGDHTDVVRLVRYDALLKEYATYLATAYYGHDVERVRWRLVTQRANTFEQRLSDEAQFEPEIRAFGWRQVTDRIDPAILEVFEDVVRRGGGRDAR